jgi:predicted transcriptional regulator
MKTSARMSLIKFTVKDLELGSIGVIRQTEFPQIVRRITSRLENDLSNFLLLDEDSNLLY